MLSAPTNPEIQIALCLSTGQSTLRKSTAPPHDTLLGLVEVSIRSPDRVKFTSRSVKYLSNAHSSEVSNQILFKTQSTSSSAVNQNCSSEFESALKMRSKADQEALNPFKCSARLYTESGRRLTYLERLISTSIGFEGQHWSCEVKFAADSETLMYDLIENHIDRPPVGFKSDEFSRENEPALISIQVNDSKFM